MPVSVLWAAFLVTTAAQAPPAAGVEPSFEVASVKLNPSGDSGWSHLSQGERFIATNLSLRRIIGLAYGIPIQLEQIRIVGRADALLSRRFDIQAKIPAGTTSDRLFAMLRSLLADRFRLQTRSEVRDGPVYSLTVARSGTLGPELRPSQHNCQQYKAAWLRDHTPASEIVAPRDARNRPLCAIPPDSEQRRTATMQVRDAGTINDLIMRIQGLLDRPVMDATQLRGDFEWQLTFLPPYATSASPDASEVPSLSVALREQLGLRLEESRGPIDVLHIESVEMPTPD
jgi:uncharacterized protein (TIGR03435 family)